MKTNKKKNYNAKIEQGGIIVVSVDAPTIEQAEKEIGHYALMYSPDGDMKIIRNYKLNNKLNGEKNG